jgi:hypothetical protein
VNYARRLLPWKNTLETILILANRNEI